jgi:ornithine cyclodeaminase
VKICTADDVRRLVPIPVAIEAVRQAFLDLAAGCFVLPARQIFGDGAVLVMSAYHCPTGTAVVKKIGIALDQVPAIRATVIWTGGGEQLVADGTSITTLRTGAVVGVATDLLAPAGSTRLALLGTGRSGHGPGARRPRSTGHLRRRGRRRRPGLGHHRSPRRPLTVRSS